MSICVLWELIKCQGVALILPVRGHDCSALFLVSGAGHIAGTEKMGRVRCGNLVVFITATFSLPSPEKFQ